MRSIVNSRQSLLDLAVQECGTFEAAFALAERNGWCLTDDVPIGTELDFTMEQIEKRRIVVSMAAQGVKPATAVSAQDATAAPYGGIGFMGIEIDFVVK